MIGLFKDPREDSRLHYGGGDAGQAIAAALYVASNIFSWSEAKQMPDRQAEANKKVLALQKQFEDDRINEMRNILRAAIGMWETDVGTILDGTDFEEAFPDVPLAAEYNPVDACCVQEATIECNMDKVARADEFYQYVNRRHEQNDLIHALSFDQRFVINLDIQAKSIQDMMRGLLPTGDVVEILTDTAEQAAMTGRIGSVRKMTARDLGISKLRMQAAGRAEFREQASWFNSSVSPLQRQGDIRGMMVSPSERIGLALSQAQLIQASLQNKNNALAQKEPHLLAKLQARMQNLITKLQYKASEALLDNRATPNFASIVPVANNNTGQLLGNIAGSIENANKSWFYGPPPEAQSGYSEGTNGVKTSVKNKGQVDREPK